LDIRTKKSEKEMVSPFTRPTAKAKAGDNLELTSSGRATLRTLQL